MSIDAMETFYISFGSQSLFGNHYAVINAYNEEIARAWLNKHYAGIWANIYPEPPHWAKPLIGDPTTIFYADAKHV